MFENALGLLDQMDQFFDILVGWVGEAGTQKTNEPGTLGFQLPIKERFKILANINK